MGKISSLFKLRPFVKKYRGIFVLGILGMIISSIVQTPVPYIIGYLMDKVLLNKRSYNKLYMYILIIAVLYILRYIISYLSKGVFVKVSNLVVNEMRCSVMDKVMNLPMSYLSKTEKGYVQSRINECNSIGNIFSPSIISVFLSIIDATLAMITMFLVNYKLAFIALLLAPVFFFLSKLSAEKFMKNTRAMMESSAFLNGESFEIMNGIEDIKILNGKKDKLNKFKEKLEELINVSIKQSKSIVLFIENTQVVSNFGSLIILLIAGILILNGQFTIGLYTSFSMYIGKVFSSAGAIATMGTTIKPVCLNIERLYELLEMKDENYGRDKFIDKKIKDIKLENVSFKYDENKTVLKSLSFRIKDGEKVLIKGENGAGKSTLIKLLLGLYSTTSGKLLYNNVDINEINTESLRKRIGIVSQNIFLFKGTVLSNILYGQTGKSIKDVEEIIKKLSLEEYVNKMPKGLNTEITQNTSGVSGGQAQIIAFIRAMLGEKDIIILDEPISNVDASTREVVMNILSRKSFGGILIVVSHLIEGMDFINRVIEI
ncbi:ATP-binding cassette subfamily C protein [Clostridium acetobutylicum]|uniref:ABC-type transport system,membrane ATPase component n=1 Tax=Clostridium acetobutylicum (strain ATCC 824 / DSM 792 / JCM 1419 / IAM 19013 / LMG 5710 / NBRC 13948 / NRRL B-527 / VKM B-1787 / 2291 / W) TaxID=272562 RepID=Q97IT2_CLOAB|nr:MULTISPECIES: ABC transporter ATP-binding protein [Clostridium]AAK79525.1 ABC-type transport system,membrane ATPase component [Clostridium acetobutylicum ATCC 824]ADZ20610.1 ABC-type transport system,membrane ATPase component [Clostridium acetobutylicum EA 2018]AEI34372.1 ABC-type transport system,membrane ATPase component [Clostridium acetobutylicum DSM 1731]AWV81231.1 ABC transporter ATP-binding protein [Clostridium acetobutylicum]MBC2392863.1 ABC transporter ATP-binding protein [Clostrid